VTEPRRAHQELLMKVDEKCLLNEYINDNNKIEDKTIEIN